MLGVLAGLAPPVTPARPAPQVASASAEVDRELRSITEDDVRVILQTLGDGVAAERAVAEVPAASGMPASSAWPPRLPFPAPAWAWRSPR